ncbi:hypothetical protein [Umezawaea sp.]|uniref:hypothetical protein n=1 Tax=Umezawaea sp. TaxID=1955258 RepID=UPI002ED164A2
MTSSEPVLDLPPYRAVLVVDTKDFGGNDDVVQTALAETIYEVLIRAFERAGLAHVRAAPLFPHNTGDGFGMGFDPRHLPAVVSRFFDALQEELAEQDARMRGFRRSASLRMRVALTVGPVADPDEEGRRGAIGATLISAHRLLDAAPVRAALTGSDPEQTFVSAVLSQRVFEDVLAGGYATLRPSRVAPVEVEVKELTTTAYLYVPKPSGDLLRDGFGSGDRPVSAPAPAKPEPKAVPQKAVVRNRFDGANAKTVFQVGFMDGDVHQGRD